ncbi:MAG: hypothetical protein K6V36_08100 [Anaerolineae bacterium]|nr:hypothetical protein [Anaerolineae bacterium]
MGDAQPVTDATTLYCANHPTVETLLRCSKCGRPICRRCGVPTPVGIRCRECAQLRRPPTYVVGPGHYLLAAVVALPVAFVAGLIMQRVGFFFAFFLGAAVGGLIAEVVCRATGGKRGRPLAGLVCACIVVGALASAALTMLTVPGASLAAVLSVHNLLALLFRLNVVYVVLAIGAAYARLM